VGPDTVIPAKKDIAVLIFHVLLLTAAHTTWLCTHSKGGYTTFAWITGGMVYRVATAANSPGKDRWIADLAESVKIY